MLYSMIGFKASFGGDKRDEECPYIGTGTLWGRRGPGAFVTEKRALPNARGSMTIPGMTLGWGSYGIQYLGGSEIPTVAYSSSVCVHHVSHGKPPPWLEGRITL